MKLCQKNLLLLSCCFILAITSGLAQEKRHFVRAGYGVAPLQAVFNGFLRGLFSDVTWQDTGSLGLWQVGYSYVIFDRVEIGVIGAYNQMGQEGRYMDLSDPNQPDRDYDKVIATEKSKLYTLMPTIHAYWLKNERVRLYSGVSFGGSYEKTENWSEGQPVENVTRSNYAFHLNAFGVRYGQRVGGFFEMGLGFHGLLNGGLSYNF